MAKRALSLLLVFIICLTYCSQAVAHGRQEHDEELEYVLFGNRDYKTTHPIDKSTVQALEDALYLCVDQFNNSGTNELANLVNNEKIPDIPKTIDEIDYTSNYSHRSLTHRGWNTVYDPKAHWPERQKILRNTVKKELFSSFDTPFSWITEKVKGQSNYTKQSESFCILLYCVHVLGDHIEAGEDKDLGGGKKAAKTLQEKKNGLAYIYPLSHTNDIDNPGLIPDIIKSCEVLFESQANTRTYNNLMQELKGLSDKSEEIYRSKEGVDTEDDFEKYNSYANELLEVLARSLPSMLRKEEFFVNTFSY